MAAIAILGATGVYGRHLVPRLVAAGHAVRALVRRPEAAGIAHVCGADVRVADVFDAASLRAGLAGCDDRREPRDVAARPERARRLRRERSPPPRRHADLARGVRRDAGVARDRAAEHRDGQRAPATRGPTRTRLPPRAATASRAPRSPRRSRWRTRCRLRRSTGSSCAAASSTGRARASTTIGSRARAAGKLRHPRRRPRLRLAGPHRRHGRGDGRARSLRWPSRQALIVADDRPRAGATSSRTCARRRRRAAAARRPRGFPVVPGPQRAREGGARLGAALRGLSRRAGALSGS